MRHATKIILMLVAAEVALIVGVMIVIAAQQTTANQPIVQPLESTKMASNANRQATVMLIAPPTRPPYPVEPIDTGPTSTPYYPSATVVGDGVIITDVQPIPGTTYRFTTMWRASLREKTYVYAGLVGGDSERANQGIIVMVWRVDGELGRHEDAYLLPETAGVPMIAGADGRQASIATSNGDHYIFDVTTRALSFVASDANTAFPTRTCSGFIQIGPSECPYP